MKTERLYGYQYTALLLCGSLAGLFTAGIIQAQMGAQMGIVFLLCVPPVAGLCLLTAAPFARRPARAPGEIWQAAYGRVAGAAVAILYTLYFVGSGAVLLNYYGIFTVDTVLHPLREGLFVLPVALVAAYVASRRMDAVGRTGVLLAVPIGGIALLAAAVQLCCGDPENLLPVLSGTPQQLWLMTAALIAQGCGGLLAAVFALPAVVDAKRPLRRTALTALIGSGIVALFAIGSVMLSGQAGWYAAYPGGDARALLQTAGGIKVFIAMLFFFSVVFRIALDIRAAALCLETLAGSAQGGLALPLGLLMAALALLFARSTVGATHFLLHIYPFAALPVQLLLPALTLLLDRRRKRPCGC